MTQRGRLIQKFLIVLRTIDTRSTASVVGAGFDDQFKEQVYLDDGTQFGTPVTVESPAVRLTAQIYKKKEMAGLQTLKNGIDDVTEISFICMREELCENGLINEDGTVNINNGDRVESIETIHGDTEIVFAKPLYVNKATLEGFGLDAANGSRINLVRIDCSTIAQGPNSD